MNYRIIPVIASTAVVFAITQAAFGQESEGIRTIDPAELHVLSDHSARQALGVTATFGQAESQSAAASGSASLPLWSYQVTAAQNKRGYTGSIVGASPLSSTKTTTSVPVVLIPVILKITQGNAVYTFDPTAGDAGCLGSGNTAFGLTQESPLFNNANFTINGVSVGDTQYSDAFLRGEFWHYVMNSGYHLRLTASKMAPLTIQVSAGPYGNSTAEVYGLGGTQCGSNSFTNPHAKIGVINLNTVDALLQSYISANNLNASQFPFFVLYNAVMSEGPANNLNYCCVLGYHNALGNPGQTYGIAEFEGRDQTVFSGVSDVAAASHEINEWINDPNGGNPTPAWGNIGQVSGCQSNFEVGDPLSGTLMPSVSINGFTFHVQELAFFSWFYGGTSVGAGGKYSSNGTFNGAAKLCPPGGSN